MKWTTPSFKVADAVWCLSKKTNGITKTPELYYGELALCPNGDKMFTYSFRSDSSSFAVNAADLDAAAVAAAAFEGIADIEDAADLVAYYERVGGYMTLDRPGERGVSVPE